MGVSKVAGIIPKGALTHHQLKLAVVLPNGSRALSEGDERTEDTCTDPMGTGVLFRCGSPLVGHNEPTPKKTERIAENTLDKCSLGWIWNCSRPVTHHRGSTAHTEE